jgi:hypothetical protein
VTARASRLRALIAAAAIAAGCHVSSRDDLVGRYVRSDEAAPETWTLSADGTCRIARPTSVTRCEWEYVEREGRRTLVVTMLPDANDPVRHRTRLVLTPTQLPGGAVTIPVGGGDLRKVE